MTPRCSCPTKFDERQQIVRAQTDQKCPVHGWRPPGRCPTCGAELPRMEKSEAPTSQNHGIKTHGHD